MVYMSNRKSPSKQQVGIRLSPAGTQDLLRLCRTDGISQSGMFERLLHGFKPISRRDTVIVNKKKNLPKRDS